MFTEKELEQLSDALLSQIEQIRHAAQMLPASARDARNAMAAFREELAELNSKVCRMMDAAVSDEQNKTDVVVVVSGGVVEGVYATTGGAALNVGVLDCDCVHDMDPTLAEETRADLYELEERHKRHEMYRAL